MGDWAGGGGVELRLDGLPDAVPRARSLVRETLAGCGAEISVWDAQLVVAELVTNALLHGAPPVSVRVETDAAMVRVVVSDASPAAPLRPPPSADAMTGRGLALVDAVAVRWGVDLVAAGKLVWAEVGGEAGSSDDEPSGPPREVDLRAETAAGVGEERFDVSLGDVPTDLLLAAKNHVDNLVREFTLAAGGAASGASATVPAHLAELIHTVSTRFAEARLAIKRQALAAVAAGAERTSLRLCLPVSAADAAEDYLAALDEADSFARAARLLTLETPPQHQAFRQWYVTSLITQLRSMARGETPAPAPSLERFLLDALGKVAAAHRRAERAARLQSVTSTLATATTPDRVAEIVLSEGVAALGASGGSLIAPREEARLSVLSAVGYPDDLVAQLDAERLDAALPAAEAMRTGLEVWLESPQERDVRYPGLTGLEPGTVAICALPLIVGDRSLGVLRFSFSHPRIFDADERDFARAFAAQTAQSLERARLFAVERRARERITFLAEAGRALAATLDEQRTLENLTGLLVPRFADWAVVYLTDETDGAALVAASHRNPAITARLADRIGGPRLDLTREGGIAEVLRTGFSRDYHGFAGGDRPARADPAVFDPALFDPALFDPALFDPAVSGSAEGAPLEPRSGLIVALPAEGRVIGAVGLARTSGEPFGDDDRSLIEDVAARAAVAVGNARRYARERTTAVTLQRSLLPQRLPRIPGVTIAWRYLPADTGSRVGGDWYDVLPLDGDKVALLIGDVMGHGIEAAAVMGQLRATARAYATAHLAPAAALARLDAAVSRLEQDQITTAAFALLDQRTGDLTVASAGHLPLLLLPPVGAPSFLAVDTGPPLGAGAPRYAEKTVRLAPGSMVLFFTDGLVEDRSHPVDDGLEVLRRAVAGAASPEDMCDRALASLGRTHGHDDDTAMLAVSLTG